MLPDDCVFQVAPPLVVVRIVPLLPTAQPWLTLAKATPSRSVPAAPNVCAFQLAPPLLVCRIVPLLPTVQPDLAPENAMAKRPSAVPDFCAFQLAPPLTVCRMVPPEPRPAHGLD